MDNERIESLRKMNIKGQKTDMIILEKCPMCFSKEVSRCHHNGDFRLPECFFNQCDEEDCGYQWDFN